MSDLAQENFERAVSSANATIKRLYGLHPSQIPLREQSTKALREMAWDLEAIASSIHMELNNRLAEGPMDLG